MKKVLVVDWLDKFGGAERVIAKLQQIQNFDAIYTLINIMSDKEQVLVKSGKEIPIKDTVLRISGKKFRWFYLFFFTLVNKIKVDSTTDLIFSSSHSVAKGVKKTSENQIHISYFQARNANYIWDEVDLFFGKIKYIIFPLIYILRKLDVKQAQQPDYIISNSKFVQEWVKETYKRESVVIYPPVDLSNFDLEITKKDYYVVVGRLAPIKRFDIAIRVFNKLNTTLYVIGDGEESAALRKLAKSPNIHFTGFLSSKEVNEYIRHAKGLIQVGIEGFGITSIEAQACGTPVIAYGKGGVLETIIEEETGILFHQQTDEALEEVIKNFETLKFDAEKIRQNALNFSEEKFEKNINQFIDSVMKKSKQK